ncbi:GH36-type glycosyl hydrolase domain-containing protein [Polaromonas sp.]|uniref:GH36-type glycosyl hydrolase domain-containing protein n=1 Tax=Polaromonas sp. TaxID=1869339 RepID=UPI003BAC0057
MKKNVIERLDALSPYARRILDAHPGASEPLISAELFGAQRFEQHGRSLAEAQSVRKTSGWGEGASFFPRVRENIIALRQAYDYIATISHSGQYVTPAAEWLLDNFHLVEAQLQQIREGLPRRYYAHLPKLADKPLEGLPRVYGIAWAYVAHTDSVLDPLLFTAFLNAYQDVSELNLGELWALPTTLRVVLLENLRRVADQIAEGKAAREAAHAIWDGETDLGDEHLDDLLDRMRSRGLERGFLTQLWQRMPDQPSETSARLARWTARHCPNGLALIAESQTAQVSANLTISNIINSLRLIGQIEWTELIEPVSRSLRVLGQLPSFARESEGTRQQITQAMEKIAHDTETSELTVAKAVVRRAQLAIGTPLTPPDDGQDTAAYHLIGPGQAALIDAFAREGTAKTGKRRFLTSHLANHSWRLPVYLCTLLAGTLAVLAVASRAPHGAPYLHLTSWPSWVALALMAWPASEAVAALIYRVTAESTRIKPMPRLDFSGGIPAGYRVLVVIPCMLTSAASTRELTEGLRRHWLANREDKAQFALLSDWADAGQASMPADSALLREAVAQVAALNLAYPSPADQAPRFLVIHRSRVWCSTEGRWIGWERKRGKLEALVRLIANGHAADNTNPGDPQATTRKTCAGDFYFAEGMQLAPGVRYILTLDSDTGLPPAALRELVSIAAHPLNAPHIDMTSRRVTGGYGILQPRVVTPLPADAERSPFHAMFAGQCGLDPYSNGSSDLYQDLFGLGTFTGKGLLNVQAVHAVLDQRFAAETILSHDLLEGTIARCAYVSDVVLVEDHPHHAGVDASRQHRWARGDWQLLPLMFKADLYGIDSLGLWKMLDNLRRSLVVPASLALLAWVVFTGAVPLAKALAVVLAAFLAGPLLGALTGLVPTRKGIVLRHFFHVGLAELWRAFAASAWQFTQLAIKTGLLMDAIGRSLWRMLISRKHLLQWTTAAQAQASARYTLSSFLRNHALASAICLALALLSLRSPHPVTGVALFLLWALGPVTAWWASTPSRQLRTDRLDTDDKAYLVQLARDTWRFFEHCVGPQDNHLPPDNLQIDAEPTLAHRTSPTNIGLYLLSIACARQFGWLTTAELLKRLQATLATVERLPKHDGHLLNWYQTETLEVLQPAYVSTVDSGNLAGHLLAVAGACNSLARKADSTNDEKKALCLIAEQCHNLCMTMNFRGLYNPKRHLFHIGLRVHEQTLDASYYDLLASESRLASFLAIAKGDVPRRHWMALGRAFLSVGVTPGLKSWSGSMFEYLMPSLVMREPQQGLLRMSGLAAVAEQQAYGRDQGLPWGVSESAYFAQDHSLAYQYSPFGVPRLALRRTPTGEHVVAPYATAMATMFMPRESLANLRRLEKLKSRGSYGFMDALDFTASRQPHAEPFSVVKSYMAHHQGMSLVALCNVLCGQAPQRWFSETPLVQAYETLLHERCPRQIINTANPRSLPGFAEDASASPFQSRKINPLDGQWQPTHLLSNGRYSVALRANGAGTSRWSQHHTRQNISRWRDDLLRDQYGTFIYIRRGNERNVHSLTAHPAPHPRWLYKARFLADRVQFNSVASDLETTTTVLVSPEDDTEIRTVLLHNVSGAAVTYEVVSCFEAVLADARADEAHPAFSNIFMETIWYPEWRAMVMSRRPRLQGEAVLSAAHFLAEAEAEIISVDCIADRRTFLGRNRARAQPALAEQAWTDEKTPINGLDPVACLRVKVRIAAGGVARLSFATAAAQDKAELVARIDKYLQPMHVERATRMAATLAQVRLRDLGIDVEENAALQDLTTTLMYSSARTNRHAATPSQPDAAPVDQRQLWRFGISGDKPIVLVRIHSSDGLTLVQSLLRAQPWWSFGGLPTDVVVLNSETNSYLSPLHREILMQRDRLNQKVQNSFPPSDAAGFYLLRDHEVSVSEKAALTAHARVIFTADGRPLETQVASLRAMWSQQRPATQAPAPAANALAPGPAMALPPTSAPAGRFDPQTGEFWFQVDATHCTPRPWVNVIANAGFGFQVSETGNGYTWAVNSRLHQLTPWSNDPVQDPAQEHFLLQDVESYQLLPLTPSAGGSASPSPVHNVHHGQGYTKFECSHERMFSRTTFFADRDDAVKLVHVQLRNDGTRTRQLRALAMAEWQMGSAHAERRTVQTWNPAGLPAVMAQQRESRAGFGGSTAFLALAGLPGLVQWSCDRGEFFDVTGQLSLPNTLGQRSGGGLDPCGAVASNFSLPAGEDISFTFILGHAPDAAQAEQLAVAWLKRDVPDALARVKAFWDELLGHIEVHTPDPLFDALVNRWLLYQTLSSRLWSRAGFYQAGGAFGFRDQLQDSMAFAVVAPQRLREQILLNASRQFSEGDVQHWWHAPGGEGVRTHFSDDLLWLPFACAHYIDVTGDTAVLDENVAFIEGAAIPEGAEDAYYTPEVSEQTASVYEHCARTLDHSLATGTHGLPLMGTGDWNDGMNRVGNEGRGESVWLAWFLCSVVQSYAPLAKARGDTARADTWLNAREDWIKALHSHGWDGEWFRRAFFDNGAPLGSSSNSECRIDLIAQAWSVLSGASSDTFIQSAMQAMNQQLVDDDAGLLRLLAPPFENSENNPGYIQAYPPGVRENGGQYSHAGVWAMMAQAQTGDTEAAWKSFRALSPAHRSQHPTRGPVYELEPYVVAGDVYGAAPYIGRGGWSWYTGSAAWLHRAALETLLGLSVRQGRLSLTPHVPADWPSFEVSLRLDERVLTVRWQRTGASMDDGFRPDRVITEGEVLLLAELPERAALLVRPAVQNINCY